LNAADEVAVRAFLENRISFTDIPRLIRDSLDTYRGPSEVTFENVMAADAWARRFLTGKVDHARIAKS
jgi:1-deoxy-D-xylulose-5-phosphate reductoisomerase